MSAVGLVHTVPALAERFHALIAQERPDLDVLHVVDPTLLARAISPGVGAEVQGDLEGHVRHLLEGGARSVLVTCSSLGQLVDALHEEQQLPLERIDRAMAEEAARRAGPTGRIVVLATLSSTLGPTGALVRTAAASAGAAAEVELVLVEEAAAARSAGDQGRHDHLIREGVRSAAPSAAVLVLAQASMAEALADEDPGVPVLTSPVSGTRRFLAQL